MIFTGFRAGLLGFTASEGKGRSGREVGNEWGRDDTDFACADAASGDDTRGREAKGLKGEGEGVVATVMREAVVEGQEGCRGI